MILGIDTSLSTAVAVANETGELLAARESADPYAHAEVIGSFIQECLDDAGIAPRDVSSLAIGLGPGPFTGLRVGIAAARTFALGAGSALIAVPSHDAAALSYLSALRAEHPEPAGESFAIITDARRRELAVTVYEMPDAPATPRVLEPTALIAAADLDDFLAERQTVAVVTERISAGAVAVVGLELARENAALALAAESAILAPIYLREPDARPPAPLKRVGL